MQTGGEVVVLAGGRGLDRVQASSEQNFDVPRERLPAFDECGWWEAPCFPWMQLAWRVYSCVDEAVV